MLIKKIDAVKSQMQNPKGGEGNLSRWDYIKDHIPCSKITTFSCLELDSGASIGEHQHADNFEVYYFLDGEGLALDNDKEVEITTGDMLITNKGESHALINTGSKKLKFLAFICSC